MATQDEVKALLDGAIDNRRAAQEIGDIPGDYLDFYDPRNQPQIPTKGPTIKLDTPEVKKARTPLTFAELQKLLNEGKSLPADKSLPSLTMEQMGQLPGGASAYQNLIPMMDAIKGTAGYDKAKDPLEEPPEEEEPPVVVSHNCPVGYIFDAATSTCVREKQVDDGPVTDPQAVQTSYNSFAEMVTKTDGFQSSSGTYQDFLDNVNQTIYGGLSSFLYPDKNNLQMGYYNTVYMGANGVATSSIDQSNPSIDDFNFDFGGSMDQVNTTSNGFELKQEEDKSATSGTSAANAGFTNIPDSSDQYTSIKESVPQYEQLPPQKEEPNKPAGGGTSFEKVNTKDDYVESGRAEGGLVNQPNTARPLQLSDVSLEMQEGGQVPVAPPQEAMPMPSGQPAGFVNDPSAAPAPSNPMEAMQGEGREDDVLGELPEGTFVINAMAVQLAGIEKLDTMVEKAYETLAETMREKGVDESLVTQLVGSSRSKAGMREQMVDVAVSNGEYIVPPEIVGIIGEDKLRKINDRGLRKLEQKEKEQKKTLENGGFVKLADGDVIRKFTGSFNSDTERLKNIDGKTFVVSKGSETKTKPVPSSSTSTMMQTQDQKADIPSDLILSSAQDPSEAPPPSGAKPFSTGVSQMQDLGLLQKQDATDAPKFNFAGSLDQPIIETKTPVKRGAVPTLDEPIIETKTQPPVKKTSKKSSMLTTPIVAQPASSTLDDSIVQEDERLVSTDSRYFPQGGRYIDRVNDVLLRNDIKFDINDANRRAGFFTDSRAGFALQDNPYALNAPNRVSIKSREVKSPSAADFKYYDTKDILFFKQLAESSPENSMLMSAYQWMIYPRTSIEEIDTVNQMYNRTKAAIAVNAKNQSEAGIVMNNIMQQIQDYTKDTPYQSVRKLASKYMDNLKQGRVEPRSQEELRKDFNDLASLRKFGLNEDQSMREYAGKMLMRGMDQSQSFVTQGADKRQQNINLFQAQQPFMRKTEDNRVVFDKARPRDTGPDVQTFGNVGDLNEDDRDFAKTISAMSDDELEKLLQVKNINQLQPMQKRIVLQEQYRRSGFLDRKMPVTKFIPAPTASLDLENFNNLSTNERQNQLASIVQSVTMPDQQTNKFDVTAKPVSFIPTSTEGDFPEKVNINDTETLNSLYTRLLKKENASYNFNAESKKGAKGFAQLMSSTVKDPGIGLINLLPESERQYLQTGEQALTDPVANLLFGYYYLKALLIRYDGDVAKALSSYNYGLGNTDRLVKKHGNEWTDKLPDETEDYIRTIKGYLRPSNVEVPVSKPTQARVGGFV